MSDVADYDSDILLWSERQAALLRDLRERARSVPNELDLENVAEEIESVGRSEFRAFESYVTQIFIHLIKAASSPDPALHAQWASEIFGFQIEAIDAMTPSMLQRARTEKIWRRAIVKARVELRRYDETLADMPANCPFAIESLLVEHPLDVPSLLEEIRNRARSERGGSASE